MQQGGQLQPSEEGGQEILNGQDQVPGYSECRAGCLHHRISIVLVAMYCYRIKVSKLGLPCPESGGALHRLECEAHQGRGQGHEQCSA